MILCCPVKFSIRSLLCFQALFLPQKSFDRAFLGVPSRPLWLMCLFGREWFLLDSLRAPPHC
jgi:hypothetical protein